MPWRSWGLPLENKRRSGAKFLGAREIFARQPILNSFDTQSLYSNGFSRCIISLSSSGSNMRFDKYIENNIEYLVQFRSLSISREKVKLLRELSEQAFFELCEITVGLIVTGCRGLSGCAPCEAAS